MARLCLIAGVLLALVASAAAAEGCSDCRVISFGFRTGFKRTLFCAMGSAGYSSNTKYFNASDFRFTCVEDVSKACDTIENTLIAGETGSSCCSCYLYAAHCHKAIGKSDFVTNKDITNNPHVLLMPSAACTGIESWNQAPCPQEAIWDEGAAILDRSQKGAGWGMAINPVSRRSQHQMHVHLAEVFPSIMDAVEKVHRAGNASAYIVCKDKQTRECSVSDKALRNTTNIKVTLHRANSPAKAQPFLNVYGSQPSNQNPLVLWASTLVVRVPKATDVWAVVTNPTGPAECFFKSTADKCKAT